MDPLTPVAASVMPEILRVVARDESIEPTVAKAVSDATGATDADAATAKLADDPAAVITLRASLSQILLDAHKADIADAPPPPDADTEGARDTMLQLVHANSPLDVTPPILSFAVVLGFFLLLAYLLSGHLPTVAKDDPTGLATLQLINVCFGAVTAGFATVLNFWLGSSSGSRRKDAAMFTATQMQQLFAAPPKAAPKPPPGD